MEKQHKWNDEFCDCGQDVVTCQGCGQRVCGAITVWVEGKGNVGPECFHKFGLGHQGGSDGKSTES